MNALPRLLRIATIGALAACLAGCISLFPNDKPAQLYRFDSAPTAVAEAGGLVEAQFGIARTGGGFVQAASGDRILTMTGAKAAYIAGARWVSPAAVLFQEALSRAFERAGGPARLLQRGEVGRADYQLRVDVTRFETAYDRGDRAAPKVTVELRATLTNADRSFTAVRPFRAEVRASGNRVSAIVDAYDQAVGRTLGELTAWANNRGAG
jgi:cholesterol transport system auxiliary component